MDLCKVARKCHTIFSYTFKKTCSLFLIKKYKTNDNVSPVKRMEESASPDMIKIDRNSPQKSPYAQSPIDNTNYGFNNQETKLNLNGTNYKSSQKTRLFVNFLSIVTLVFCFISFQETIVDCPTISEESCALYVGKLLRNVYKKYLFYACVFSLVFLLAYKGVVSRSVGAGSLALLVYIAAFYDPKITTTHYGGVLSAFLGMLTAIISIALFFVLILIKLGMKFKKLFLITATIITYYFSQYLQNSCWGWEYGLHGLQIEGTAAGNCQVAKPNYCFLPLIESFIRSIPAWPTTCQGSLGNAETYFKYFKHANRTQQFIAFRNTQDFHERERLCEVGNEFQLEIYENARSVRSLEEGIAQGHEIILDVQNMQYHINVSRNEKLVKERVAEAQKQQKYLKSMSKKVLVIFIDALSRAQFHRALPQTREWLERRANRQKAKNIEFFRMYSVKPWTYPNYNDFLYNDLASASFEEQELNHKNRIEKNKQKDIKISELNNSEKNKEPVKTKYEKYPCVEKVSVQQGVSVSDWKQNSNYLNTTGLDPACVEKNSVFNDPRQYHHVQGQENAFIKKGRSLFTTLKEHGFITARSVGSCLPNSASVLNETLKFHHDDPPDHEGTTFSCDPHFQDPYDQHTLFNGPYAMVPHCVNNRHVFEYQLEYGGQFWRQYRNDSSFLMLEFVDAHEATETVIQHLDAPLANWLQGLEDEGLLDDTLVMFMADHGNHMHLTRALFDLQQVLTERMMPLLIMSVPQNTAENFPQQVENLQKNQQKLVTFSNLHFFMQSWIRGGDKKSKHFEKSLMNAQLPADQSCQDVIQDFNELVDVYSYAGICVCTPPTSSAPSVL